MDAHQASSHQIQHRDSEPCGTDNQKDEAESWNRVAAMLVSLGSACCKCIMSPFCTLYLFLANEEHGRVHHAQEFENRFWNIFCSPFLMALSFCVYFSHCNWASDGVPGWDFVLLLLFLWAMQCARLGLTFPLDRHSLATFSETRNTSGTSSLNRLKTLGIPVKGHQLDCINACLKDIDQLLTPSIINNFINQLFVLRKEWAIISIFEECDAPALRIISRAMKLKTKMINYSVESRKRRRSIGV
mmetsp:Transcript_3028/g.6707  ORF Transcript_3028/g.6707 Transcript_3028/m.6707 type:complete len:244 (-) Transcript_3028:646-1377(-)